MAAEILKENVGNKLQKALCSLVMFGSCAVWDRGPFLLLRALMFQLNKMMLSSESITAPLPCVKKTRIQWKSR